MNENIFREYDIRGVAGKELDGDTFELIGKGLGTFVQDRFDGDKVVIGRDCRLTSEEYAGRVIDGLRSTGCNVIDIGMVPTPVLYFAIFKYLPNGKDVGVVVTASHNPKEFNGIKMRSTNQFIFGERIQQIKDIIKNNAFMRADNFGLHSKLDITQDYVEDIFGRISLDKKMKVVVDTGNGTAGPIVKRILDRMDCDATYLFNEPDGNFPNHLADPTVPEYTVEIRKKVVELGADIGLALDGDGDRIGVIDDKGNLISADILLAILARGVLERKPGEPVVYDVKCSMSLIEEIEKCGGKPVIARTGYPLVQQKMWEVGACLGGEMSGHIYMADDFYGFDDGIYSGLKLLEILSKTNGKFSDIISTIPTYIATPEIRLDCPDDEIKFKIIKEIRPYFESQDGELIDIDGYRINYEDGWGLVRASNTQPILVVRFEAKTEERLEQIKDIFRKKLSEYPSVKIDF